MELLSSYPTIILPMAGWGACFILPLSCDYFAVFSWNRFYPIIILMHAVWRSLFYLYPAVILAFCVKQDQCSGFVVLPAPGIILLMLRPGLG